MGVLLAIFGLRVSVVEEMSIISMSYKDGMQLEPAFKFLRGLPKGAKRNCEPTVENKRTH